MRLDPRVEPPEHGGGGLAAGSRLLDRQDHPGHEGLDDVRWLTGSRGAASDPERRRLGSERAGSFLPRATHVVVVDPVVRLGAAIERRVAGRTPRRPGGVAAAARQARVPLALDTHGLRRLPDPTFAGALSHEARPVRPARRKTLTSSSPEDARTKGPGLGPGHWRTARILRDSGSSSEAGTADGAAPGRAWQSSHDTRS